MNYFNQFEIKILDFIRENLSSGFLDAVMPYITKLADDGIFWIILALVLLFFKKTRKVGAIMGVALVFGLIFGNLMLKPLIARIRPYDFNPDAMNFLLVDTLSDFSFPSGHTLASFEGAGVLMFTHKKTLGYPALIIAFIIAFSRLYLYVHYPLDVLAGMILGILFAYLAYRLVNLIVKKYSEIKTAEEK